MIKIPTFEEYEKIVKALYGGRSGPIKKRFESSIIKNNEVEKVCEEVKKLEGDKEKILNLVNDCLIDLDVVSLYPAAMKNYKYPTEIKKNITNEIELEKLKLFINAGNLKENIYIINCDIECKKDVYLSLLPRKYEKNENEYEGSLGFHDLSNIKNQ